MEEIKAYRTSDGTIFADQKAAVLHEEKAFLKERLKMFFVANGDFLCDGDQTDVAELIAKHHKHVFSILERYMKTTEGLSNAES